MSNDLVMKVEVQKKKYIEYSDEALPDFLFFSNNYLFNDKTLY